MDFDNLPDGWELVELKSLLLNIQYGYTASAKNDKTGIKLLRVTDLQSQGLRI